MSRKEKIAAMRAQDTQRAARKRNLAVTLTVIGVFAVVLAAIVLINRAPVAESGGGPQAVRADSHRLQTAPDGKVTLVEFLDFECEGCAAHYPVVEQLRKDYAGKVTFVVRYFPIASHFNAERAARAVEAAAQQGKFEAMYQRMFERQPEWGEKRVPADQTFRGYAQDLGLDVAAWEKAYRDPATLKRVTKDAEEGQALGVEGTPTFFLNGTKIQPQSADEFKALIDAALKR
ncbi:thioredoxin domain-containing protein [Nonomuraea sp. NPDC050310]|uniref:DsbA family protein n=1 Tax=Nonomuraea sp. NPDC050310 TaxID=3154935 RepID=UPI0033FA70BD